MQPSSLPDASCAIARGCFDRVTGKIAVEVTGVSTPILGRNRPMVRYTENATFIGMGRIDGERRFVLWDARTGAVRTLPM